MRPLPLPARVLVIALLSSLGGCLGDGITEPPAVPAQLAGVYVLTSIDGAPLPVDVGFALGYPRRTEILAGTIEIAPDGWFVDATEYRMWSPDETNYEQFRAIASGHAYLAEDHSAFQFRPATTPAYTVTVVEGALVQQWNERVLKYEKVVE